MSNLQTKLFVCDRPEIFEELINDVNVLIDIVKNLVA